MVAVIAYADEALTITRTGVVWVLAVEQRELMCRRKTRVRVEEGRRVLGVEGTGQRQGVR
jgi:hypothetical protein